MTHIERLQTIGIRRFRIGKRAFRYQTADGRDVPRKDLARINALRIPPAWTEVAINPAPSGQLQAIGKDVAGRWQYIYHANHVKRQERLKYQRLTEFGASLPVMRQEIARQLRQTGLQRQRVLACILKIVSRSFLRPGSEVYANEHGSFGITTLRSKHVAARGDQVVFDFSGKSGVPQHRELRDRQVAQVIKELLKRPGRRVFQYEAEDGTYVRIAPRDLNSYIKEVMGEPFTAKDFRTWAGTLVCASALARMNSNGEAGLAVKKKLRLALTETAKVLGNTPAVCRSSYVCPAIIKQFEKGRLVPHHFDSVEDLINYRGTSLHPVEKALLRFLKNGSRA
jgi:DNA topoisomerase-1